jgi:hypothetical protein
MYEYAFELFHIIVCSRGFAFVYFFCTSEHLILLIEYIVQRLIFIIIEFF